MKKIYFRPNIIKNAPVEPFKNAAIEIQLSHSKPPVKSCPDNVAIIKPTSSYVLYLNDFNNFFFIHLLK